MINNVGRIDKAEISLDNIAIISGENDTGKSTIGKLLFSIIKADNIAREKLIDFQYFKIKTKIEELKQYLIFNNPFEIKKIRFIERDDFDKIKDKNKKFHTLKKLIDENYKAIKKDQKIKEIFDEIYLWLTYDKSFLERRKIELINQINYNFGGIEQIVRENSVIKLQNKDLELYKITLDPLNFFDRLPISDGKRVRPFLNAVFIETPIIMNLLKFFLLEKDKVNFTYPFILRDLARELIKTNRFYNQELQELIENIKEIIKGDFVVENEQLIFKRNRDFNMLNVATGIKSFGILLLLLRNNVLRNFATLLIIDEPEIHLHPKWQVKYVQTLIEIYKSLGTKIVITTHSPYIIDAFERSGIGNFYLLKDGVTYFKNDSLKDIYDLLGEPLWS